ncbi:MAG: M28 family peptidase [Myxococcota bacterium]
MYRLARPLALCLLATACDQQPSAPPEPPPPAERQAVAPPDDAALARHLAFFASDTLRERTPGSTADVSVQDYIEGELRAAGLEPGFGVTYRQQFEIVDGVQLVEGGRSALVTALGVVPHSIVPFAKDTLATGAIEAPLLFVANGFEADYAGISDVGETIVVAVAGPDVASSEGRRAVRDKVVAARERGAVGFVLWDPAGTQAYPNRGRADDLDLPSVFVSSAGNLMLQQAFGVKKATPAFDASAPTISKGTRSRKPVSLQSDVERVVLQTANVAGLLVGSGASSKMLVVGAHHDHRGGRASSEAQALDGASGVAGVLELCGAMASLPARQRPYDLLCVAFGAEQMESQGAKLFVDNLDDVRRDAIVAMLNVDEIGGPMQAGVQVGGMQTAPQWQGLLDNQSTELAIVTSGGTSRPGEHVVFYKAGVPVLDISSSVSGTMKGRDADAMRATVALVLGIVDTIVHDQIEFEFRPVEMGPAVAPAIQAVSMGATFADESDGVRIEGVLDGGPAAEAGLKAGDRLRRIGGQSIARAEDVRAALQGVRPGETRTVLIERKGAMLEFQLTFASVDVD